MPELRDDHLSVENKSGGRWWSTRFGRSLALILLLLLSLGIRLALAPVLMNRNDRRHFIGAAHKTLRYGLASIYERQPDYEPKRKVRLPYPPVLVYVYAAVGFTYDRLFDPSFSDVPEFLQLPFDSHAFGYLIKLPIFLFELLLTALIFLFVRRRHGERRALLCAALYALNPAVLYDSALWAQPDAIHSAFLALSVVFLIEKKPAVSLSFLTLALLSKPQAFMAAPLILMFLWTTNTVRQNLKGLLASSLIAASVFAPFLIQKSSAVSNMLEIMAGRDTYVSGNAHNFWWLIVSLAGLDPKMDDSTAAFAGLSYVLLSAVMLIALYAVVATLLMKRRSPLTAEPFAYVCLLVFVFAVRMHENHGLQILPLLLLTGLALRHQRVVFGALTAAMLANMLLYSPEIVGDPSEAMVFWIGIANSALNVATLFYWSWVLLRSARVTETLQPESMETSGVGPARA